MVIYLDMAFLLNCAADAGALYAAGQLSGLPVRGRRLLLAAGLGGAYGAVCVLPGWGWAAGPVVRLAAAAGLMGACYGRAGTAPGRLAAFYLLSCAAAGVLVAGGRGGLDWRAFLVAGGLCYGVLSVVYRGGARHGAAGRVRRCVLERGGRRASLTALLDTGHTLTDGLAGSPVLTAYCAALDPLWTGGERQVLAQLEREGAAWCMERLGPGWRLLPYRAVGVRDGLLLCFRADGARLGGKALGRVTVALSPTPVSGGCEALWGGEEGAYAA